MILFLVLLLSVFGNEPHTVDVAKAAGIEQGIPIPVFSTDVVAVVVIDDETIYVISAILI